MLPHTEFVEDLGEGVSIASIPVVTARIDRVSYDVRVDGETVSRFLYLDHGDQAKDLAVAFARGVRYGRRHPTMQ